MNSVEISGYMPPPEFEEDSSDKLVDLALSGSTELFLIQWPLHQHPEINGKEFTLQLGPDGKMGSFIDSSGKTYDFVSSASQERDATVILSSASESKIVGKISRRVSLVRYMEPEEYEKRSSDRRLMYQKSSGTLMANSSNPFLTPVQSKGQKSSQYQGRTVSTHSSKPKSTISGANEIPMPSKRKHDYESIGSMGQSAQNHGTAPFSGSSGRVDSKSTFSGPSELSHKGKSKKKA